MAQKKPQTSNELVETHPIKYYIPLAPFERRLISSLEKILDTSSVAIALLPSSSVHVQRTFHDWTWTKRVKDLEKEFEEERLQEEYDGDKRLAYEEYISSLGRIGGELVRVQCILNENKMFMDNLGDTMIKDVEFSPIEKDLPLWKSISRIYEVCGRRWKTKTIRNLHGTFEIWKLINMFTISWKKKENESDALDLLLQSDRFLEKFDLEIEDDEENEIEDDPFAKPIKLYSRPTKEAKQWPAGAPKIGGNGMVTDKFLTHLLYQMGRRKETSDPRGYIHVVPWSEIEQVETSWLIREGIDIEIPFHENALDIQWALWTPPHKGPTWNHQLFTEEEVFSYNILNDWSFPDHSFNGKVLFSMRELDATEFIPDLFEYWETWNDCAITQEPLNSRILLLETIPGLRFRSRLKNQDRTAARNYFRNLVEAHATKTLNKSVIRSILGTEGYSLQYEHALRVIPVEQLSIISWDTPLGQGANGAVYAGTWERPASVLTTTTSSGPVAVVLKEIVSRKGEDQSLTRKFLKELDSTFTSLSGLATSCVKFFGITAIDDWTQRKSGSKGIPFNRPPERSQDNSRIMLVFERATQGTIPNFLESYLSGIEFVDCWDRTADALSSIANGISTLHRSNVLHRDLHLNNILVTDRYYTENQKVTHEYQYLLSDLGEGKVLRDGLEFDDKTAHHASYGATDFRAPEIRGNHGWSTAAEVFSYGVIACKILDLRLYFCSSKPPMEILDGLEKEFPGVSKDSNADSMIVPTVVREAVEPCLAHLPEGRPSIREATQILQDLLTSFTGDRISPEDEKRVTWTYWDWNKTLREGRLGTVNSDKTIGGETDFSEFAEFENVS